jgi:uncharacterized membrane protein
MDFMIWAVRSLHLFSIIVWLGGMTYQVAVALPVEQFGRAEMDSRARHLVRRFLPFVWMCVWTILLTGIALMLFSPRFVFLKFDDAWSLALALKQTTFLLMTFFSFGYARMFSRMDELLGENAKPEEAGEAQRFYRRMVQFAKITVALGIVAVLLASAMR